MELRGPPPDKCTNVTDFMSLDDLTDLSNDQFFSFQDVDGFVYGFDLRSIYHLIFKQEHGKEKVYEVTNPYNRNKFPSYIVKRIRQVIALSKLLKKDIQLEIEDEHQEMSAAQTVELRTLSLFQEMDALGNYTNYLWFQNLTRGKLCRFIRELFDIFNFRAQLSIETKRNICPPYGDPFRRFNMSYLVNTDCILKVRVIILELMEKLIYAGVNHDSRCLGAYYVLGALTLVSEEAAISLPWLYQSVSPF